MNLLSDLILKVFKDEWFHLVLVANSQIRNFDDAKDVVQDLYIELDEACRQEQSSLNRLKTETEIGKFLRLCAKRRAIDYVRKLRTRTYGAVAKAFQVGHIKNWGSYTLIEEVFRQREYQWLTVYQGLNLMEWEWWLMEQVAEGQKVDKIYQEGLKLSTLTDLKLCGTSTKDIELIRKKISSIRSKAAYKFPQIAKMRKPTRKKIERTGATC